MGCCQSQLSDAERNALRHTKQIQKQLDNEFEEESQIFKLLLLGTGQSGKSTIFKQMQILYGGGTWSEFEKMSFQRTIRRNVIECMQTLIQGLEKFQIPVSQESVAAVEYVKGLGMTAADQFDEEFVPYIQQLWTKEDAIQEVFQKRSQLQLLTSTQYLLEHVERIAADDYEINEDDILRLRLRTCGIVEKTYPIEGTDFKFMDVGGQRNERRKWINCFEYVTAVIFVTAINEFDELLYENEEENRMEESLKVWDNICNNRFFKKTAMILFLNKSDLFRSKLEIAHLSSCFEDYDGDNSFEDATDFIRDKFLEISSKEDERDVYCHITCATNTKNVQMVFNAVKDIVLQASLGDVGVAY